MLIVFLDVPTSSRKKSAFHQSLFKIKTLVPIETLYVYRHKSYFRTSGSGSGSSLQVVSDSCEYNL